MTSLIIIIIMITIILIPCILYLIIKISQEIYGLRPLRIFFHPTNTNNTNLIIDILNTKYPDQNDLTFYELGAGDGRVSYAISNKTAFKEYICVDSEFFISLAFNLLNRFKYRNKLNFIKKDVFELDYKENSVFYVYMGRKINQELYNQGKFKNSIVVSLTFPIESVSNYEIIETNNYQKRIYIYDFR